jgi:hypothetical protein
MPFNRTKALYQPWNEEEFLSDQVVREMNEIQSWMYRTLCQKAFCCSTRPYLPDDDEALWRLAGCKNKEQWLKNRTMVLKKFKKVTKHGEDLLYHKRIKTDWDREKKRRQTLANNGSKGGKANQKKQVANATAALQRGSSTELNRTEPNCTELNGTELDETMKQKELDPLKHITQTLVLKTGQEPRVRSEERKDLSALGRAFGGNRVCEAVDSFFADNPDATYIGSFLKSAKHYLGEPTGLSPTDNTAVQQLNAKMYSGYSVTFAGRQLADLGKLLKNYTEAEILEAFAEFASDTDRNPRYLAKDFAEGGAEAVLLTLRKAKVEETETQKLIDDMNQQYDKELAERKPVKEEPEINPEDFL